MAGDILIVDSVATNRIVLKVKLLAAQYRVRPCASIDEARSEIVGNAPDLIILDTVCDPQAAYAFFKDLKADPATSVIPIVATGGFADPMARVRALDAGADDVMAKPFTDSILQARIRSLLRARDARAELQMREGTRQALGFAEAATTFRGPLNVIYSGVCPAYAQDVDAACAKITPVQISKVAPQDIFSRTVTGGHADLILLDFGEDLVDETALFRLLSEMRSRIGFREAAVLVILPQGSAKSAAMALDLGANDVVFSTVLPEELAKRAEALIRNKQESDALRRTVESGLEAAITDPLTGLYNRRYALPHLNRLAEQSIKTGRQFAIMALDLDHFKRVNDVYGHAAGDEVLKAVADRLRGNLRAVDLLARIGGEEFLIAIPESDVVHARTAAERLCNLIGDTPFFVGEHRQEVHLTVSVGVSLSSDIAGIDLGANLESLVNAADTALYAAKTAGRNTVSLSAA